MTWTRPRQYPRTHQPSWRSLWLGLAVFLIGAGPFPATTAQAKSFTDVLSTDFQGGILDNVFINQNIKGGIQLAPYAMLGNWQTAQGPTTALYLAASTIYNGKVYITGGKGTEESFSSGQNIDQVLSKNHFSNILADGSFEKWDPEKLVDLPQPTYGHSALALNGKLYIIGGRTASATTLDAVYWGRIEGHTGEIKALYTPNTWTAVASLPMPLYRPAAVAYEGRFYVLGGQNGSDIAQDRVFFASVAPNGDIPAGGWLTASSPLPTPLSGHSALVTQINGVGRIYVIGGSITGEPRDAQNQVYIGTIDTVTGDVTGWQASTPLPEALYDASATMAGGRIWISGGARSGTARAVPTVYAAGIDPTDGSIPGPGQRDTWMPQNALPAPVKWHNFEGFNNHLLVIGGTNNSGLHKNCYYSTLVYNRQNITAWVPTTPLFLSPYGGGERDTWTGHTVNLKWPIETGQSGEQTTPLVVVIGGGPNTFIAYADGNGAPGTPPAAYATVYQANIATDGTIQTWSADPTHGEIPVASILHTSAIAVSNQIYVMGGVNSTNAAIFAGAPSRSSTAFYSGTTATSKPDWWHIGLADVFYEDIGTGTTSQLGSFEITSWIPIRDPAWLGDTLGAVYQPLIRSASAANNDVIYVLGGISRLNLGPKDNPTGSQVQFENRVWYCRPNPGGSINSEGQAGGWNVTTPLPTSFSNPAGTLYDHVALVANNSLYIFGGRDQGGIPQNTVFFSRFNPDGTLGPWNATTSMPLPLANHQVLYMAGRFYLIGGSQDPAGGTHTNAVFSCIPDPVTGQIPPLGFYGTWEASTTLLQYPVAGHKAVGANGFMYILGGHYNLPHTSNTFMTSIVDLSHRLFQAYSFQGSFERYIDLDQDQLIDSLNWLGNNNGGEIWVKCRYALAEGAWSGWTQEQNVPPIVGTGLGNQNRQRAARYIQYKIRMSTNNNAPGSGTTPLITQVDLNYAASKNIEDDGIMVNHNRFDPQIEPLLITYKTRKQNVATVILRVYNLEGELIRRQDFDIPANTPLPHTDIWSWDGTNENGEMVANGVYVIQYNSGDTHKILKVVVFKR